MVVTSLFPILLLLFSFFLDESKTQKPKKKSIPSWEDEGLLIEERVGNVKEVVFRRRRLSFNPDVSRLTSETLIGEY